MSRPKNPPHRVGVREDLHRTEEDEQDFARWLFLQEVARQAPDALRELRTITLDGSGEPAAEALLTWAGRWHLSDPWCLSYARATAREIRRLSPDFNVWFDCDDVGRQLTDADYSDPTRLPPRKDPEHFVWLVQRQILGWPFAKIQAHSTFPSKHPRTVETACKRLSAFIGLSLLSDI